MVSRCCERRIQSEASVEARKGSLKDMPRQSVMARDEEVTRDALNSYTVGNHYI